MTDTHIAYVGLGSNLGSRQEQLRQAIEYLNRQGDVRVLRCSSVIETAPLTKANQPDYLNQVAEIETSLGPEELLSSLFLIEKKLGRTEGEKWASRVIDLDLLFYGDQVYSSPTCIVPHPQAHLRSFVLRGMCELCEDRMHPVLGRTMRRLLDRLHGGDYCLDENRPQLVSVAGLIGVGKSTLAERLADCLQARFLREEYDKNPFLADVYEGQESAALDSELFFLSSSASQLQKKRLRPGKRYMSDYVFDKALIYARQWLDQKDLEKYLKIYESVRSQVHLPVLVIYMEDAIENCLQRIHRRKRPYEQHIEPAFLEAQKAGYEQLYTTWRQSPVIRICAAECKELEQAEKLAQEITYYLARQETGWTL